MNALWPHQERGIAAVLDAIDREVKRICLTSPTGMGKSRMVCELILRLTRLNWYCVVYTNRRMLVEQLSDVLAGHGIDFGIRAAGHEDDDHFFPVQISSLPTEASRVIKRQQWALHGQGKKCLAIIDECHVNDAETAQKMMALHLDAGHFILGVTATPLGIGDSYDELLVAGTVSEGRECGALVKAIHYGPDEPDYRALKVSQNADPPGTITEPQVRKLMGGVKRGQADQRLTALYGRVWENFERLNPEHKPSILFASGVGESIWFAQQFTAKGVRAAHIDGEHVWIDGELHRNSPELRREVLDGSRKGAIPVLCNRFVLREGVDAPWLGHGVFATVFGSLQTYLQSGGRLLRAFPGMESVTIQDHGGNWWRHGSLNEDRIWQLGDTAELAYSLRADRVRNKRITEPFRCPRCAKIVASRVCACGWKAKEGVKVPRAVLTTEGVLRETRAELFRPHSPYQGDDGIRKWKQMYFRAKSPKWNATFRQAMAYFAQENNWKWPDTNWPLMPFNERDFFLCVADVPPERLR